jgi:hypothetical protein
LVQVDPKLNVSRANPSFIKSLKLQIGEDPDYDKVIARYRSEGLGDSWSQYMKIIPVNFNKEHKAMLGHCKMIFEKDGGRIAINPDRFDKLITAVRTAVDNDGALDKEATSYNDIFDAWNGIPVRSISLNGIITTVHSNSGLVKRCNKCKSIMYDTCPKKCSEQEGWGWDLRVSSRLYDGSGSIKMVLTKDIASRVLNRNLSELILLASQDRPLTQNLHQPFSVEIKIPESIEIIEAVTENASSYRSNGKRIVTDGRNLVFFPPKLEQEEVIVSIINKSETVILLLQISTFIQSCLISF